MSTACPHCGGPGDYGPGPCTACSCRTCHGAAYFGGVCPACGNTGRNPAATSTTPLPLLSGAGYDQARQGAAALARILAGEAAVAEAELAAHGIRPVTVVHGDPEDDASAILIYTTLPTLARQAGHLRAVTGGNDHTTFLFDGPDAELAAQQFTAEAQRVAESWWKITPTAQPIWR